MHEKPDSAVWRGLAPAVNAFSLIRRWSGEARTDEEEMEFDLGFC